MKDFFILSIALLLLYYGPSVKATQSSKELKSLVLNVRNIKHGTGKIFVAVFDKEDKFMKEHFADKEISVYTTDDLKTELKLPNGKYAISIFHDVNNNRKLNTNFMGIPREPYGFSNNPKTTFGPPDFEKASFVLDGDCTEIDIILK
ncbi:MAG: DUF2141 domain-containing protein [Cytophagales bacterium]|nr:DUF2141 domain-containing protein [Cytophagales bacterium]